ncbi:glycosyltransferase 87 family protein [Streptomyces sp. NPDC050997]|uniref:glycosyltransferase 87 family protein n=1 Tax=Streptomyces sp. NPDC050997 TaxID=3155519 RepID=UPI00342FC93B
MDNAIVVRAARTWWAGGSPYDDPHFLYLPSAVLAAAPQVLLPPVALRVLVPLAVTGCLVAGWACALRLHRVPLRSRLAVLGLGASAVCFAPFGHLVLLGNWTATAAPALPSALLPASRGRWAGAGAVIGAAIALKPLLAPMALLFLFARQWRGLAALVLARCDPADPGPDLALSGTGAPPGLPGRGHPVCPDRHRRGPLRPPPPASHRARFRRRPATGARGRPGGRRLMDGPVPLRNTSF